MNELAVNLLLSYRALFAYGILMIEIAMHIPIRRQSSFPLRAAVGGGHCFWGPPSFSLILRPVPSWGVR